MKRGLQFVVAVSALAAILILTAAASALAKDKSCSVATLDGTYEAILTGTVNGLPFAALDLVTADGNGNMTATGTIVSNGTVIPTTFTATYTVNSDCSGTFASSTGTTENIAVTKDGSEVRFIVTGTPLGLATVTGLAKNVD